MESVKMSMYPVFHLKHRNKTKSNLPLPTSHAKSLTIILFRFFKSQIYDQISRCLPLSITPFHAVGAWSV